MSAEKHVGADLVVEGNGFGSRIGGGASRGLSEQPAELFGSLGWGRVPEATKGTGQSQRNLRQFPPR